MYLCSNKVELATKECGGNVSKNPEPLPHTGQADFSQKSKFVKEHMCEREGESIVLFTQDIFSVFDREWKRAVVRGAREREGETRTKQGGKEKVRFLWKKKRQKVKMKGRIGRRIAVRNGGEEGGATNIRVGLTDWLTDYIWQKGWFNWRKRLRSKRRNQCWQYNRCRQPNVTSQRYNPQKVILCIS